MHLHFDDETNRYIGARRPVSAAAYQDAVDKLVRDGGVDEEHWPAKMLDEGLWSVPFPAFPGPAATGATGFPPRGGACMSPEQLKTLVRREFAEVWNQGNLAVVDILFAPDYLGHDSGSPEPVRGREALKRFFFEQRIALPDLDARIEDLVAEGDRVVVRWTTSGTQRGELLGVPPTGKRVAMTGISILRVADGQFAEEWTTWDALAVLRELGVAPH